MWVGIEDIIVSFVRRTGPDMRRVEAASFDIVQVANYNLLVYHCAVPTQEFRLAHEVAASVTHIHIEYALHLLCGAQVLN